MNVIMHNTVRMVNDTVFANLDAACLVPIIQGQPSPTQRGMKSVKIEGEINLGDEPYSFEHDGVTFEYRPNRDKAGNVLRKDPNIIGQTTTDCGVLEYTTPGGVHVKGQFSHAPMGVVNWAMLAKNGLRLTLDGVVYDHSGTFGGYITDSEKVNEPKVREVAERLMRAAMAGTEAYQRAGSQAQRDALRRV